MGTSLKTDFAQIFSHCPKNLSCPKFGGAAALLAPPARTPMFPVLNVKFTLSFLFLRDDIQSTSRSKSIKADKISPVHAQNIFELQMFYEVIQQRIKLN